MKQKKLKDKVALDRLKKKEVQYQRIKELSSQIRVGGKEINRKLKECNLNKELDYSQLLPLDDLNIQRLDEIIKILKEDPIEDEFDYLQYYQLSRELNITMKKLHQKFDFGRRLGIYDEKNIENLMNQMDLINIKMDKMTCSGRDIQKTIQSQEPEILINVIRQSISNRNKELLN